MLQTAEEWIERLRLKPLEWEGGYYRETARSDEVMEPEALPARYTEPRALYTAIYYLITPESSSALHRLKTDEVFTFIAGDPVRMLQLFDAGIGRIVRLGNSGAHDVEPQVCVPRRVWQGCKLEPGGRFALLGTTVAPGFDFADFELADPKTLLEAYPKMDAEIREMSPPLETDD